MMRRILVVALLGILAVSIHGCKKCGGEPVHGSGQVVTDERRFSDVRGVALATSGKLTIELGDDEKLTIRADDNLLDHIATEVRNGILVIGSEEGFKLLPSRPLEYRLTIRSLDTIVLAGNGEIKGPDIQSENVGLTVSGSGSIHVPAMFAETLRLNISGSGHVNIARGSVETQELIIAGSGKYNAEALDSSATLVKIAGSGTMAVQVQDRLEGVIDGSGRVRYVGDPEVRRVDVNGTGSVKQIGV